MCFSEHLHVYTYNLLQERLFHDTSKNCRPLGIFHSGLYNKKHIGFFSMKTTPLSLNSFSKKASVIYSIWLSVFTKLLTKHGKHIITEYKMEILFSFEYLWTFSTLEKSIFYLVQAFC